MNELNQTHEFKTQSNLGDRIVAGLVDYIIIFAFCFFYVYSFGEPNDEGGYNVNGLPALVPIFFWVMMTIGFEQWFGATIGNLLVGLKPISILKNKYILINENKLTFGQSFKRHLLDPTDMPPDYSDSYSIPPHFSSDPEIYWDAVTFDGRNRPHAM